MAFPLLHRSTGAVITEAIWNELIDGVNLNHTSIADDGTLDSTGGTIRSPLIVGYRTKYISVTQGGGTLLTLDLSAGTHFKTLLTNNILTLNITNVPADVAAWTLIVQTDGNPWTITWPASVLPAYQSFPTITSTGRYDIFDFEGTDYGGGQLWWMTVRGQNF